MRVLASSHNDASSYYRTKAPFGVLNYQIGDLEILSGRLALGVADEFDLLWLQMDADAHTEVVAREFKDAGKPVVYDVDDWLFDYPPSWANFGRFFKSGSLEPVNRLGFHERLLRMADVVTTTTPYLAKKLQDGLKTNTHTPDVRVLENYVLQGDWDTLTPSRTSLDAPVVGWFGSANHWDDWFQIAPHVGAFLDDVDGNLAILGAPEITRCFSSSLLQRTHVFNAVPMRQMEEIRHRIMTFDVGIAWSNERTESALCRSPLKALQYHAAGVPCIGSPFVYEGFADFITSRPESIMDYIEVRIMTEGTRAGFRAKMKEIGARARDAVFASHTYELNARKWLHVMEGIV